MPRVNANWSELPRKAEKSVGRVGKIKPIELQPKKGSEGLEVKKVFAAKKSNDNWIT
ncbi:hypothetical protein [endosymbiont DhMRE of Dentiscutata heterogama]|uniref:hypothetical protein n=1 Tax=endosymbiont DhMRE of Dentiscutata heterogama TaxID=1609546 RepID=UPI002AD3191B|nr:hypothetical protein [endosymbiont DhMRE of Dentiscutata heterogama]